MCIRKGKSKDQGCYRENRRKGREENGRGEKEQTRRRGEVTKGGGQGPGKEDEEGRVKKGRYDEEKPRVEEAEEVTKSKGWRM